MTSDFSGFHVLQAQAHSQAQDDLDDLTVVGGLQVLAASLSHGRRPKHSLGAGACGLLGLLRVGSHGLCFLVNLLSQSCSQRIPPISTK